MTRRLLAFAGSLGLLTGCAAVMEPGGTGQECTSGITLSVSPSTATADHAAAPPGNQQQFVSSVAPTSSPGCATPAWVLANAHPSWVSSDPAHVSVSSANDQTNGTAVCLGSTNGPATLTATITMGSSKATATATLTCK